MTDAWRAGQSRVAGWLRWDFAREAFEHGWHEGHRAGSGPTKSVERILDKARRQRRNPIIRLFRPLRSRFLDGFIKKLEHELDQRARDHELPFIPAQNPGPSIEIRFKP